MVSELSLVVLLFFRLLVTRGAVIYVNIREKEEDDALEQARQNKEQEHAKQMEKMKRERMREAERRKREAVSENIITFSLGTHNFLTQDLSNIQYQNILSIVFWWDVRQIGWRCLLIVSDNLNIIVFK